MRTIEKVIAELKDEMLDGGFTEIHCDKCLDEILEIHKAEQMEREYLSIYLKTLNSILRGQ